MKFTCESCSAQYMISDEKVGPNGVKVRCKKCGNVVVVRRAAESSAEAPAQAGRPAPTNGAGAVAGNGLDAELGQAFDTAFGDPPAEPAASGGKDLGSTQLMGAEDQARIAAAPASAAAPADTEWYVAIGQAQVGPLPLAEVKRKWEAGDVGPDSLVWRPSMVDWKPLSSVAELAGYLAPVPRAPQAARAEASRAEFQPSRAAAAAAPAAAAPPAAPEAVTWKPAGASALAALASEEIAARAAPEPKPTPARGPSGLGGANSLVDALPDGGGVDPTGAIPLSIKGMEKTDEKKIERRSSVASRAEEARHKRSVTRAVVVGVIVILAAVGGAAAYVLLQMKKLGTAPAAATAAAPTPPAPEASQPTPAPPAPDASKPAAAAPAPESPAPVAAAPTPEPARPEAKPEPAKPEPTRRSSTKERRERTASRTRARPQAKPDAAPSKKKDGLLDFGSSDSALAEALGGGGGSSGRSVYVPPARGAAPPLPDKLSPAQINESVAGQINALRRCVSEQKARNPGASGVLRLRWVIGSDGNVRSVKTLTSEYASSPFAHCITGVVKSIRFPRSATKGQEVTFPFSF